MKKLLACLLAVMLCVGLLAGCGGDDNNGAETTDTTTVPTDTATTPEGSENVTIGDTQPSTTTEPIDEASEADLTPYPTDENGMTSMGDLSTYPTYASTDGDLEG